MKRHAVTVVRVFGHYDVGETASSLLRLRKRDLVRYISDVTKEPEYEVSLRREILKRSRTPRTEPSNYKETVELLDQLLEQLAGGDFLFPFGHRMAAKILERAVRITKATCLPNGETPTLKDLRSSMACDLLGKGWTTDEVNQRLGHKPSSREIDKYVSWLALDRRRPKQRYRQHQVGELQRQVDELKNRENLLQHRHRSLQEQFDKLRRTIERNNRLLYDQVVKLLHRYYGDALGSLA